MHSCPCFPSWVSLVICTPPFRLGLSIYIYILVYYLGILYIYWGYKKYYWISGRRSFFHVCIPTSSTDSSTTAVFRSVVPRQPAACTNRGSFFLEIFVGTHFTGVPRYGTRGNSPWPCMAMGQFGNCTAAVRW
eukprot:SAG11_NODE_1044_length_6049_cov_4.050084_2_plen_133_part_00